MYSQGLCKEISGVWGGCGLIMDRHPERKVNEQQLAMGKLPLSWETDEEREHADFVLSPTDCSEHQKVNLNTKNEN